MTKVKPAKVADLPAPPPRLAEGEYLELLGQRVRGQRMRRGMTRKQLAQDSGVSERYLAELEAGRGNVSILLLREIARAMGLPLADLVSDRPDRGAEEELLGALLARLDREQLAQAHGLLTRASRWPTAASGRPAWR
jgi:XRE family aerobic/anaerobic benzoate catabolism transcriptional regulator